VTTFTNIPDTTLAQDRPFTQSVARGLRDNPVALAEGDGTAPEVVGVSPYRKATASNSPVLLFDNLPDNHSILEFDIVGIRPMASGSNVFVMEYSINNGTSWINSGYQQADDSGQASIAYLALTHNSGSPFNSTAANTLNGWIRTYNFASTTSFKQLESRAFWMNATPLMNERRLWAQFDQAAKINAVRFRFLAGNVASGNITLRRVRAS